MMKLHLFGKLTEVNYQKYFDSLFSYFWKKLMREPKGKVLCIGLSINTNRHPWFIYAQTVNRVPTMQVTAVQSLSREDPLEKEMAPHSSIFAWKIPWSETTGCLQFMGSQRDGHD